MKLETGSVGGIYQRFSSKESIVHEIAGRYDEWIGTLIFAAR